MLTRKQKQYYAQKTREAKELFKSKTGQKTARGFSKSDEFKRVKSNRRRAEIRVIKSDAVKVLSGDRKIQFKEVLEEKNLFFKALSDSDRSQSIVINRIRENEMLSDKDNITTIVYPNGSKKTYYGALEAELGLQKLNRFLAKEQRSANNEDEDEDTPDNEQQDDDSEDGGTNSYPLISATYGETSSANHIVITASY